MYMHVCNKQYIFLQKFESRKAVFLKTSTLTDAQKDLWQKVVIKEFMSSEESDNEIIGDGELRQVIKIKTSRESSQSRSFL